MLKFQALWQLAPSQVTAGLAMLYVGYNHTHRAFDSKPDRF